MPTTVWVLIAGPHQTFPDRPVVYRVVVLPAGDQRQALQALDRDQRLLARTTTADLAAAQAQASVWVEQYAAVLVTALQPVATIVVAAMGDSAIVTLADQAGEVLAAFTALTSDEVRERVAALAQQFPAAQIPALPPPSYG